MNENLLPPYSMTERQVEAELKKGYIYRLNDRFFKFLGTSL